MVLLFALVPSGEDAHEAPRTDAIEKDVAGVARGDDEFAKRQVEPLDGASRTAHEGKALQDLDGVAKPSFWVPRAFGGMHNEVLSQPGQVLNCRGAQAHPIAH